MRLLSLEIRNFKNVGFGRIEFPSYKSAKERAEISDGDVTAIVGPNGSGKSAVIDALEILAHTIIDGMIPYDYYAGMTGDVPSEIRAEFLMDSRDGEKYFVRYKFTFSYFVRMHLNRYDHETLSYKKWENGHWARERSLSIVDRTNCAEGSAFFGTGDPAFFKYRKGAEAELYLDILLQLQSFASFGLYIHSHHLLKAPLRKERFLSLLEEGEGEVSIYNMEDFERTLAVINKVLPAVIPGISIVAVNIGKYLNEDDYKIVRIRLYSQRDGRKCLTKFESDGVKRLFSIVYDLVEVFNDERHCLVVDDLDYGVYEYLLGELVETLEQKAKGQVIFTTHNYRTLEKLPIQNFVTTTMNEKNKYIRLKKDGGTNGRDIYIRALTLGGQKEEIYRENDLIPLGMALWEAGEEMKKGRK